MGVTGGNACSGGIYVVAVTKDNEIEFWGAATTQRRACRSAAAPCAWMDGHQHHGLAPHTDADCGPQTPDQ
jgi:hypothetical protein